MNTHPEVQVIGGGLGGLATAALVARGGRTVTVHEGRGRLGGRATTDECGGFRFNQGPHALYVGGEGMRVLHSLGVTPSGSTPPVKGTRAVRAGEVHLAPVDPISLLRTGLLGLADKVELGRLLVRLPKLQAAARADQTVADLVDSFTDRPAVRGVLHTLVRLATYVNDPANLSAEVAISQLQYALADGVSYLDDGWEQLVRSLVATHGVEIVTGERLTDLPDAPAVVVATGGPDAASTLTGHRYPTGIAAEVAVLDLGLSAPARHDVVLGVDAPFYLSNHGFMQHMTPPGHTSASLAQYLEPGDSPDRERLAAFAAHAGITRDAIVEERYLHRMTAVTAIATAEQGGLAGRADVAVPDLDGVFVVGDWVGARGHLLDAVLASADEAATRVLDHLDRRPVLR